MKKAGYWTSLYFFKRVIGARGRNRTGTPLLRKAADFKSDVSTYFTTRAHLYNMQPKLLALKKKRLTALS